MSVNPITRATTAPRHPMSTPNNSPNAAPSAQEEAGETMDTTRREAALGDQVAVRKLARMEQQNQLLNPTPAAELGKGETINRTA